MAGDSSVAGSDSAVHAEQLSSKSIGWLILLATWAVAFFPAFWVHLSQQAATDHLSHFPLTIILSGVLFYTAWNSFPRPKLVWTPYGIVLLATSLIFAAGACWLQSGWLGTASGLIALWALIELHGGISARSPGRAGVLMLWALLQPPFGMDISLVIALQKLASKVASAWLDWQGIANMVTGVVIRTPTSDYLVDEACSGVNSLFASLTVGLFWILYSRYGVLRSLAFLSTIIFWVLLLNAFRVWAIVYFAQGSTLDLTKQPLHSFLGFCTFAGVILLSASTDWLFTFLLPPKRVRGYETAEDAAFKAQEQSSQAWKTLVGVGTCLLIILSIAFFKPAKKTLARNTIPDASLMPRMSAETLPEKFGAWNQAKFEFLERDPSNAFGLVSQGWKYSNGRLPLQVSIDGPYDAWHDLGYCYGAIDWQLRDSHNVELTTAPSLAPLTCVELNLYRGDGERSLVMFTSLDSTGAVVKPPASHGTIMRNITNRLGLTNSSMTADGRAAKPPIFQIQLFVQTGSELDPSERSSIDQFYDMARRQIARQLASTEEQQ